MKAILSDISSLNALLPGIRMVADSAIGRQREPYWLDTDSGRRMTALVCPCYRIGRLGKNIDRRFALRYIDAFTAAALIIPEEYSAAPMDAPEIFLASTNALIPGDDILCDPLPEGELQLKSGDELQIFNPSDFAIEAVARLSEFMTLKNGDRIIDCGSPTAVPVGPRQTIETQLGDRVILRFKIH